MTRRPGRTTFPGGMVLKGQFLERPTLVPVAGVVLEGLSHRGEREPPLLIVPPPPFEGGSMDHVVAAEVAWAAATSKHATLRFNYRGVGASQGGRGEGLVEDAEAALRVLEENTGCANPALLAIGGSAQVALELVSRHPGVGGIALVNPARIGAEDLSRLAHPLLVAVAEEYRTLPLAALAAAVTEAGGLFEVIEGADVVFTRNLPRVGRAVARWLAAIGGQVPENTAGGGE